MNFRFIRAEGAGNAKRWAAGQSWASLLPGRGRHFSVFDTTNSLNAGVGNGIPRLVPSTPITSFNSHSPVQVAPNQYTILTLPAANETPFNPVLGISDFGPFPAKHDGQEHVPRSRRLESRRSCHQVLPAHGAIQAGIPRRRVRHLQPPQTSTPCKRTWTPPIFADAVTHAPLPIIVSALKGGLGN